MYNGNGGGAVKTHGVEGQKRMTATSRGEKSKDIWCPIGCDQWMAIAVEKSDERGGIYR